jgi:hypothetical protein
MVDGTPGIPAGLCLPPDVIQPFLLRFRREDLHCMAFFGGHPVYEAVEAMIKYREDGTSSIRAILTRHDQVQIDHVNDDALAAEGHGVDRQTCHRPISLNIDRPAGRRHARLEFVSHAGEQVVLDITTLGEPDPARGGISDPGDHSLTSSLPLMRRGASTLAGPQTGVWIDGKKYDVPVRIRSGPFVAHEGYYTERHLFGAIRAGATNLRLTSRPDRIDVGAAWVFECDGQRTTYSVAARCADGRLQIVRAGGPGEIITASVVGERLVVSRISRVTGEGPGLDLTFDARGRFGLSMDGESIIVGAVDTRQNARDTVIELFPVEPDWAVTRQVRIACGRSADRFTFVTTIGATPR